MMLRQTTSSSAVLSRRQAQPALRTPVLPGRGSLLVVNSANKGFGGSTATEAKEAEQAPAASTTAPANNDSAVEALEARMRSRRARKVEPKVKVESAAVDAVTGKGPAPPTAQAETAYISAMFFMFGVVLLQGLIVAGSGFLPEEWDAFVQDVLYPGYTPTVLVFLSMSTAYGLWKVGKLPLPFLGTPPPMEKDN